MYCSIRGEIDMEEYVAQRTIIELVSDLSGEELGENEGRTVNFSYDGVDYTIDLTEAEATEFDHVMEHYTEAATRIGGRRSSGRRSKKANGGRSTQDLGAIREWARDNGYEVSDRGRIAASIREAYDAAPH
jgi:hypothetical protein